MITPGINFIKFNKKSNAKQIKKKLQIIIKDKNQIINSLSSNYKNNFDIKKLSKIKKFKNFRIIGMGGSILGTQAIHDFLKHKIKKNFTFIDNLQPKIKSRKKKKFANLIVSKSGETIETIANLSILIKKTDKNIFITENSRNYLNLLANKLKSEIIHHNNYIGGRYSVLSEVGMLPAELMGLNSKNFKQFNHIVKNEKFINALISNVASTLYFIKNKKSNSIILNYDKKSESLFNWYQQLIAESLGKKKKGLMPIVSNMPKDNHSLMQFYLDGFQNNFFTFFYVNENKSDKINNNYILPSKNFLKNKKLSTILFNQKEATKNIFKKKKIPFRSFEIKLRNEKTLGELFCFFILETILLGKFLKINPYDQPAVELIKNETKKKLI
tara:strand:+ start:202 stop:1356 length:1155 start_codon:yes stop_codon:yes gene_type:complete